VDDPIAELGAALEERLARRADYDDAGWDELYGASLLLADLRRDPDRSDRDAVLRQVQHTLEITDARRRARWPGRAEEIDLDPEEG